MVEYQYVLKVCLYFRRRMTLSIIERKYRTMILEYVLLAVLLLSAVFIIVAVVFQKSADEGLSGTIAGGAETFFGKQKGKAVDKVLSRVTNIVVVIFIILVVALFLISASDDNASGGSTSSTQSTVSVETSAEASDASAEESAETSVEASAEASVEASAEVSEEASVEESVAASSEAAE